VPRWERSRVVLQFGTKEEEKDDKDSKDGKDEAKIEEEDMEAGTPPAAPAPAAKPAEAKKEDNRLVLSGFVRGEDAINGKPAILDLPAGKGRVILFSFNPLHRFLNLADFRFVYNALLNWNDLPQ